MIILLTSSLHHSWNFYSRRTLVVLLYGCFVDLTRSLSLLLVWPKCSRQRPTRERKWRSRLSTLTSGTGMMEIYGQSRCY